MPKPIAIRPLGLWYCTARIWSSDTKRNVLCGNYNSNAKRVCTKCGLPRRNMA